MITHRITFREYAPLLPCKILNVEFNIVEGRPSRYIGDVFETVLDLDGGDTRIRFGQNNLCKGFGEQYRLAAMSKRTVNGHTLLESLYERIKQ